ncbi:uncharacterized protein LOC142384565 [Odontesthes bonariensis]|uniref:uncharacterized protein LOC142384565 n=1 Tax=Odontesthes bonariensis TaxID=219752 RepID=UPI003F5886F6
MGGLEIQTVIITMRVGVEVCCGLILLAPGSHCENLHRSVLAVPHSGPLRHRHATPPVDTQEPSKTKEVKCNAQTNTEEVSEESQGQNGVIGWLSNGFVSALPQPPVSPRLTRANSDARSGEDGERPGVIGWVTQGLTKVLPQPDDKYKEASDPKYVTTITTTVLPDEHTEVYEVAAIPDYDPLPHIPVVEMVSEDEASEVESLPSQFPPNVVNWIKHIIPQPVVLPPGVVPIEPQPRATYSSLEKST